MRVARTLFVVAVVVAVAVSVSAVVARADDRARPARAEKSGGRAATARPSDGGVPPDGGLESGNAPRPVRVRLLDGSTVVGTVRTEEATTLVIDCAFGVLSIPRARISTIAYDAAAGIGQKRAPVQQLDDEDKPTKKRATQP